MARTTVRQGVGGFRQSSELGKIGVSVAALLGRTIDEVWGVEESVMAEILVGALGALVLLAGLSVYSALRLAKRTDELVSAADIDDEPEAPLVVRFPDSVFAKSHLPEVTSRER